MSSLDRQGPLESDDSPGKHPGNSDEHALKLNRPADLSEEAGKGLSGMLCSDQ